MDRFSWPLLARVPSRLALLKPDRLLIRFDPLLAWQVLESIGGQVHGVRPPGAVLSEAAVSKPWRPLTGYGKSFRP